MDLTKQEKAILDTISYAEQTFGVSINGYNYIYGNKLISGWSDETEIIHGRGNWIVNKNGVIADFAGRYQISGTKWVKVNKTNIPMTKENQDNTGIKIINELLKSNTFYNGEISLVDIISPNYFSIFLQKCCIQWGSLPLAFDVTIDSIKKNKGVSFLTNKPTKYTENELYTFYKVAYESY
jgi:muramidase (phage lysozyme)